MGSHRGGSDLGARDLSADQHRLADVARQVVLLAEAADDARAQRAELIVIVRDAGATIKRLVELTHLSVARITQIIADRG